MLKQSSAPRRLALVACLLGASLAEAQQPVTSEYVTVRLPHGLRLLMPRNWRILTDDSRITLNAASEALLREVNAEGLPSSLPFAANYYDGACVTAGILNARYYPTVTSTQSDVRALRPSDIREVDSALRAELTSSAAASGNRILQWLGTTPRDLDGKRFLITAYRRSSPTGGVFHVRLVRLLDGSRSFTVTISYREDERLLIPIVDYMIASLKVAPTPP